MILQSRSGSTRKRSTEVAALTLAVLGFVGCGVPPTDSDSVEEVARSLGSALPQVTIGTWQQLVDMTSDGNYLLTKDLDGTGKSWTPKYFKGTLDGAGHRISNLTVQVDSGSVAGMFFSLDRAIVRNLKLIGVKVSGGSSAGGLAARSDGSLIDQLAVEGTVTQTSIPGFGAGGIVAEIDGGELQRSYFKGTVAGFVQVGGLVGYVGTGIATPGQTALIHDSYAQVTVTSPGSDSNFAVAAGGIAGLVQSGLLADVYAIGDVAGRGFVGGLVGALYCQNGSPFVIQKGIYRGNVTDRDRPESVNGGWSGVYGKHDNCQGNKIGSLLWDKQLDPSTKFLADGVQLGATTAQLRGPTSMTGGIFGTLPVLFSSLAWDAGTNLQYPVLTSVPGPNAPPR